MRSKCQHHQGAQPEHAGDAAAAQEIVQGIVDRPRLLLRARQAVEIIQHVGAIGVALEIQLPATAQFAEEQRQPPPQQEAFVVNDKGLEARIGDLVDPVVELGEEVAYGQGEDGADV